MWWLYHLWGKYRSFSVDYFVIFISRFIDCKDTHFFLNGKNYLNVLMWECVNALVGLIGKMSCGIEKGHRETAVVCRRLCRQGSPCYGVGLADKDY